MNPVKSSLSNFSWGNTNRYNSFTQFIKNKFGERVQKLSIDAGFTCPNRDGKVGTGGCSYCDNNAFNPSYCHPDKPIQTQLKEGIEFYNFRYRRAHKFIAYFQAYSNTYADPDHLKKIYQKALEFPDIVGLTIGTRPDCISDEILDHLKQLNEKFFISIEYGLESCYDQTLRRINRGHDFDTLKKALEKTSDRGLHATIHLIFGLPGETVDMMMDEAEIISHLPFNSLKLHQLQIIKGTGMENEYKISPSDFKTFTLEEYIDFIISFIEKLNPEIMIDRFLSEVPPRYLSMPSWGLIRYDQVLGKIISRLEELDSWQGKFYNKL